MLSSSEPERDRWLWAAPALSREQVRAFDLAGAGTDEVVQVLVAALRLRESWWAERLAEVARARDPGDPTIRALVLHASLERRSCRYRGPWRPADAEVAELRRLAERSAFARYVLVRALLGRREPSLARRVCDTWPPELRSSPSEIAARAMTAPSLHERLRELRGLRARWPAWRDLLTAEVWAAHVLEELDALEEAYLERCRLLGRRAFPRLARTWARVAPLEPLLFSALGASFATGWWWSLVPSFAAAETHELAAVHVLDLPRPIRLARAVLPAVFVGGMVANATLLHADARVTGLLIAAPGLVEYVVRRRRRRAQKPPRPAETGDRHDQEG
jgi:hypothetical protein